MATSPDTIQSAAVDDIKGDVPVAQEDERWKCCQMMKHVLDGVVHARTQVATNQMYTILLRNKCWLGKTLSSQHLEYITL